MKKKDSSENYNIDNDLLNKNGDTQKTSQMYSLDNIPSDRYKDFGSKDNYIKTLEMSIAMLQNELHDLTSKLSNVENSSEQTIILKNVTEWDFPCFSECSTIEDIFEVFYKFLANVCSVVELDLFIVDSSKDITTLPKTSASVHLEEIYNDLEERGLLEWCANSNEIKVIQSLDDNIDQIKSLIIIPIKMLKKQIAFFIANSTLELDVINQMNLKNILVIAQNAFTLISMINSDTDKSNLSIEYKMLREQTLNASNQIAVSEIITVMNEELEIPLKVIKTNLDLIQKGVGNTVRRTNIIAEQFIKLLNLNKAMQSFGSSIEHVPTNHNFIEIIHQTLEILESNLSKNGILVETNFTDDGFNIVKENIYGFRGQIVFAILNIIQNAISTMPDGGKIHVGVYKNDDETKLLLIINDDGNGIEMPEIDGDLIALTDLSEKKVKIRYLFMISQNIICKHNGKFSVYSKLGKGTTYKIILPISN